MNFSGKHFQKFGKGVFTCPICNRGTRTSTQGGDSPLCPECWELAGFGNQLSDDGQLHESDWTEVLRLFKKAVKQGSDAARMRQEFPELLERFGAE